MLDFRGSSPTCRACLEDEETRQAWQQWPCLSRQLGMELRLGSL